MAFPTQTVIFEITGDAGGQILTFQFSLNIVSPCETAVMFVPDQPDPIEYFYYGEATFSLSPFVSLVPNDCPITYSCTSTLENFGNNCDLEADKYSLSNFNPKTGDYVFGSVDFISFGS